MKIGNDRKSMNMISFIFIIFCMFLTAINSENEILRGITIGETLFYIYLNTLLFFLKINEKIKKKIGGTINLLNKRTALYICPGISLFGWTFGILNNFYVGLFLGPATLVLVVAVTIVFSNWDTWKI